MRVSRLKIPARRGNNRENWNRRAAASAALQRNENADDSGEMDDAPLHDRNGQGKRTVRGELGESAKASKR